MEPDSQGERIFDLEAFRSHPLPTQEEIIADWGDTCAPVLSILCTTYNHRPYIEDALRGFLLQRTTFPFEIVIHDDASTDGTSDVLRALAEQYPRLVRLTIQSENQYSKGHRPFRLAASAATGAIFALCEGDDFWIDPLKLQVQHDYFANDESLTLVHSDYLQLSSNRVSDPFHPLVAAPPNAQKRMLETMLTENVVITLTSAYRASIFRAFYAANVLRAHWTFADYALSLYATVNGKALFIPRKTAVYRIVQGSATHRGRIAMTTMALGMHECRMHYLPLSRLSDEVQRQIITRSLKWVLGIAALTPEPNVYRIIEQQLMEKGERIPLPLRVQHQLTLRFRVYLLLSRVLRSSFLKVHRLVRQLFRSTIAVVLIT